jgi:hypothetical protein
MSASASFVQAVVLGLRIHAGEHAHLSSFFGFRHICKLLRASLRLCDMHHSYSFTHKLRVDLCCLRTRYELCVRIQKYYNITYNSLDVAQSAPFEGPLPRRVPLGLPTVWCVSAGKQAHKRHARGCPPVVLRGPTRATRSMEYLHQDLTIIDTRSYGSSNARCGGTWRS